MRAISGQILLDKIRTIHSFEDVLWYDLSDDIVEDVGKIVLSNHAWRCFFYGFIRKMIKLNLLNKPLF